MVKEAPSPLRLATMIVFAITCFGLLLFLWLSFGGTIPLKPKPYEVRIAFPEATTLAVQADVRVAGVTVGKVQKLSVDHLHNRTFATISLDKAYVPLRRSTHAILRQKTLLGETYVELALGRSGPSIPENGRLADAHVQQTVQLDEILDALDPQTRREFQVWQQDLAKGLQGRGQDFNDAIGSLPGFAHDANDVLAVLDTQQGALQRLVKNTAVTFGALNQNQSQLRNLVTSSKQVFDATASREQALEQTVSILPTFLDESKATMARLQTFSTNTQPLIQDLQPDARELGPTFRDLRALSPNLKALFIKLGPLITASQTGMPAGRAVLRGLKPLLAATQPFLEQLNPILQYLEMSQWQVSDFVSQGAAALAAKTASPGGGVGHYLRQFGPTGLESLALFRQRPSTDRGNSYPAPMDLAPSPASGFYKIVPQWDCIPSGGPKPPTADSPGCFTRPNQTFNGRIQGRFPHITADSYSK